MKVFLAFPFTTDNLAVNRVSDQLRSYGHECHSCANDGWLGEGDTDPDECDAILLGQGWSECPICRNIRNDAVNAGKVIAHESDLSLLDMRTLTDPTINNPRYEYRMIETPAGIKVQVKGRILGVWHTVKTFRDDSDPQFAKLLAEELMDVLTDN